MTREMKAQDISDYHKLYEEIKEKAYDSILQVLHGNSTPMSVSAILCDGELSPVRDSKFIRFLIKINDEEIIDKIEFTNIEFLCYSKDSFMEEFRNKVSKKISECVFRYISTRLDNSAWRII